MRYGRKIFFFQLLAKDCVFGTEKAVAMIV